MDSMPEDAKRALNDKFMLRLPDGMRDRIKTAAERNNRSMNAEIVATLEEAFPPPVRLTSLADVRAALDRAEAAAIQGAENGSAILSANEILTPLGLKVSRASIRHDDNGEPSSAALWLTSVDEFERMPDGQLSRKRRSPHKRRPPAEYRAASDGPEDS